MTCRHCRKESDNLTNYCPHCGTAFKASTEAENHAKPYTKHISYVFAVVGALIVVVFIVFLCKSNLKNAISDIIPLFIICLIGASINVTPKVYRIWQGKNLPLIKRIARVSKERRGGSPGKSTYYTTFEFPDGTFLEFTDAYGKLKLGDRVVLKYKRVGKLQTPMFCGYERLPKE